MFVQTLLLLYAEIKELICKMYKKNFNTSKNDRKNFSLSSTCPITTGGKWQRGLNVLYLKPSTLLRSVTTTHEKQIVKRLKYTINKNISCYLSTKYDDCLILCKNVSRMTLVSNMKYVDLAYL